MTLVVVRPRAITEVKLVVDVFGKDKVVVNDVRGDARLGKARDGDLALLQMRMQRAEKSPSLGRRITGATVRFPNAAIGAPVRNEVAAEYMLDSFCKG